MDAQRAARYERIFDQLSVLIDGRSPTLIAAMGTICAVLQAKMPHHSWTGFYLVAGDGELHVGPYQGPVACQVLKGAGVCLHAAQTRGPVVVPEVEAFAGHVACDPRSKSEIVLPILREGEVVAVLDVDSDRAAQFTEDDIAPLERILSLLEPFL